MRAFVFILSIVLLFHKYILLAYITSITRNITLLDTLKKQRKKVESKFQVAVSRSVCVRIVLIINKYIC